MPQRRSHVAPSAAQTELASALAALRESSEAPIDFPADVIAEAEASAATVPALDLRDLPFATLDPEGSRDLDQAFHLERAGTGYTVRYAIADVPGFVLPGGAVDTEARRRGQTLYAADGTIPLHPRVLSEDRASLLADVDRPALVWTFSLDSAGVVAEFRLERALIRSRAQLDYETTQRSLDRGEDGPAALLPEIGALRMEQERLRGGASLNLPDEEVVRAEDGTYAIERRSPLPVEEWNAQLSLMTGMAAASLMLDAGVGILRTMPEPDDAAFAAFRHQTEALGRPWTTGTYGEYLRGLDRADPMSLPVLEAAATLFRGAGYLVFDGEAPHDAVQAAIAAPYAHATAPLRRLVDRWVLAICLAASNGDPAPEWARASLSELPSLMQESGQRASRLNSATVNCVEAALLTPLIGTTIDATVIELRGERAAVQIADPAVTATAPIPAGAKPGDVVRLRVIRADIAKGEVEFSL
ncbi:MULTISPECIES: RNB domain-containing ribonuclease [unclassified Microbacterium]|uniref:RNB domain-containing ribonuclease n=1 Tax=unclassified Microbacterium TaxID=2609290 RepID=UPI000CFA8103|nr:MULTISPECIES: RNB domain-containing ribonuclease [unclassified Microbacterium]PQZ61331.1 ribonuclease II [Microbacterium sp. MYb43]PQZ82542.1 ribonuclease II [Microbacterium sp. MYb40]PRB23758.1 ribonuclease II [Microbacterium sp. MYb54]PRB29653.1 ribonuclease II [Microbacterium sp. MYb50]PRB70989.1 ribonuclease II [Microbacterium sp. MYb24]